MPLGLAFAAAMTSAKLRVLGIGRQDVGRGADQQYRFEVLFGIK
jgi:hypothetical protein